jgi:hypothetical protein
MLPTNNCQFINPNDVFSYLASALPGDLGNDLINYIRDPRRFNNNMISFIDSNDDRRNHTAMHTLTPEQWIVFGIGSNLARIRYLDLPIRDLFIMDFEQLVAFGLAIKLMNLEL